MKKYLLSLLTLSFIIAAHAQGIITTIAGIGTDSYSGDGGPATSAGIDRPYAVALDGLGNFYIADGYNSRIRKVDAAGTITTIAGTGTGGYNGDNVPAASAEINHPNGMAFDHSGNLYFADPLNCRIRKINATTGIITTVAGNGTPGYNGDNIPADSAELYDPHGVALDDAGNLYITDFDNHRIRKVNTAGIITTVAGTGVAGYTGDNGPADTARFGNPAGLAIDGSGAIYIADVNFARIRKVSAATYIITTVAGDGTQGYSGDNGPATSAKLGQPTGIAIDAAGNLYIADFGNDRIRYVTSTDAVQQLNSGDEALRLYPNPSQGLIYITVTSGISENATVTIANVLGEKVQELSIPANNNNLVQINACAGVYFVTVATNAHKWCEEIIIQQ